MSIEPLYKVLKITENISDVKETLEIAQLHQFNSVIMKLSNSNYKREYRDEEVAGTTRCFTAPSLALPSWFYTNQIIPMIEITSDIDNEDEEIRLHYERKVLNDIQYAGHIKPTGPIYIKPSPLCKAYKLGKFLKQAFIMNHMEPVFVVELNLISRAYSRQMHFDDEEREEEIESTWSYWNKILAASDYSHRLELSLVISPDMIEEENEITRWLGEYIHMIVLQSDSFTQNSKNYPTLARYNRNIVRLFMQFCRPVICFEPDYYRDLMVKHYKDYISFLERQIPYDEHSLVEQDTPRFPLQPLKDNLDYGTYETFETDPAKYILYQRAIEAALKDMVKDDELDKKEIIVMVVGAGQGPLVRSALNAAQLTKRKIKVVILEKNPNAINILEAMKRDMWHDKNVDLIFGDMRKAEYEGKVDILVSELLGSFGDNELSPECLDGVQHCLKPTGISIPCDSVSYLRPVMCKRVNSNIVKNYDKKWEGTKAQTPLEVAWLVYFGSVYYIDDCKECFKFVHPNHDKPIDNSRHKTLEFKTQNECVLNGFAGYFTTKLYKDIEISIHPDSHTQAMRSWYSIYFPFKKPIALEKNDRIEVSFWRKCDEKKVWYEYQVIAPKESEIMNLDGNAHPILLSN